MTPVPYRVAARRREAGDTVTLVLEPCGAPIPAVRPGRFTMLYAFGVGEAPISVSRCGVVLEQTVRDVGAVTHALCASAPGTVVGVRGPYGTAWGVEEAAGRDLVFAAGGIGLAPLRAALLHALDHRESYGRITLLIGARTPRDLLYAREFAGWRERGAQVEVTVDRAEAGWYGHVGLITSLLDHVPATGSADERADEPERMDQAATAGAPLRARAAGPVGTGGPREAAGQETAGLETAGQETAGQERAGRETAGGETIGRATAADAARAAAGHGAAGRAGLIRRPGAGDGAAGGSATDVTEPAAGAGGAPGAPGGFLRRASRTRGPGVTAFVCGPEIMMRLTAQALAARGIADVRISLERNMRCGVGWCGHCQLGPWLLCRDGPVVPYAAAAPLLAVKEL